MPFAIHATCVALDPKSTRPNPIMDVERTDDCARKNRPFELSRQAELQASEWREVTSQVSLSNGNALRKLKNQVFFSIAIEWFKAFPRDWLFLESQAKFEKKSPERSRVVCTRGTSELRSSVILAMTIVNATHCDRLRPTSSTCPCKKPCFRLHTDQVYKRDGFRIRSRPFCSHLEAICLPFSCCRWRDRFDWVLCLGSPFEL